MSADTGIRFRDPFVSHERPYRHLTQSISTPSGPSYARSAHNSFQPYQGAFTPPPDMQNATYPPPPTAHTAQEQGRAVVDQATAQSAGYRAPSHLPADVFTSDLGHPPAVISNRPLSPIASVKQPVFDDPQSHTRRDVQTNSIAPSFRIPKSVNDSGGSLSELAAEITCLFWFEPAEVLQLVEDSSVQSIPSRQLCAEARPTTGFRKWVTTILSTTLVAQNVVLLALLFVYRLKKLNPTVRGKPGSEYRLLTVALMLGNKFLDDNTYTNKTWAEVSGIMVSEVHIMEVEFLSNMKYCLFTSAEDWMKWQTLLGKFAAFVEKSKNAGRPQPMPILPPASSLHLPMSLPSPPASNHASPPYATDGSANHQYGLTPTASPLAPLPDISSNGQRSRKRSLDDYSTIEHPAKRPAPYTTHVSPQRPIGTTQHNVPRLPLPNLVMPGGQAPARSGLSQQSSSVVPVSMPARAMAMVYPNGGISNPSVQAATSAASVGASYSTRQQSPYPGSATASPTHAGPSSGTPLHPQAQISPSYFLQRRNSPYRPVHHVSTLLYPPPSGALHQRPQTFDSSQMHYQPLGKPIQHRQSGQLPYVSQNVWLDGNQPHAMTPLHQWSGFQLQQQQQQQQQQQSRVSSQQ